MKKILLLSLPAFALFACKDRKKDVTLTQPININGASYTPQQTPGKTTAQVPAGVNTALKTNPAHGQPGHRCDLEEGAPLNSTPVTASIPPQVTQQQLPPVSAALPATQTVTSTATPAKGSGKLNPEHGKPGHRCDIPVGASLDAPAPKNNPTVTTTQTPLQTPQTTVTPVNTPTLPGMNPQHGQPGHRCDIAVGAPLNSPKADTEKKDSSSKS